MKRLLTLLALMVVTSFCLGATNVRGGGGAPVDTLFCIIPAALSGLSSGADLELDLDVSECVSTLDWFDGGAVDTDEITIPAGITRLQVRVQLRWDGNATGTDNLVWYRIQMGLGDSVTGFANGVAYRDILTPVFNAAQPMNHGAEFNNVIVAPADVLDIRHTHTTGGTLGITNNAATTWVQIVGFSS